MANVEDACPFSKGQLLVGSDQSLPCREVDLTLSDFQMFQEKPESGFLSEMAVSMLATRSKF